MFKKIFNTVKKIAKKIIKEVKHFMEINQEVEIAKIEARKEITEIVYSDVKNAVKIVYSDAKSSDSFSIFMIISSLGVGIAVAAAFINHYNNLHKNNEVIVYDNI